MRITKNNVGKYVKREEVEKEMRAFDTKVLIVRWLICIGIILFGMYLNH
jgi:hypothetical protein